MLENDKFKVEKTFNNIFLYYLLVFKLVKERKLKKKTRTLI